MSGRAPHAIVLHAGAGESYREDANSQHDICQSLYDIAAEAEERLRLGAKAIDVASDVTAVLGSLPHFKGEPGAAPNAAGNHEPGSRTAAVIALDSEGNLAATNLTGGTTFKRTGRDHDAAVNRDGVHADANLAVVCSGTAQATLTSRVAGDVAIGFRRGHALESTAKTALLHAVENSIGSSCGVIALTSRGEKTIVCTSRTLAVAFAGSNLPTHATIMPTSLIHLRQLIFYEDDNVTVSFARYPTMAGQAIMELKNDKVLVSLDLGPFRKVWEALLLVETVLKTTLHATHCSCAVVGGIIHIFTYTATATNSRGSRPNHAHQQNSPPWKNAWTSMVQSVASSLAEDIQNPATVQINIDFDGTQIAHMEAHSQRQNFQSHPKPAKFHSTYPGYMSVESGPRAADLEELPEKARLVAQTISKASQSVPARPERASNSRHGE